MNTTRIAILLPFALAAAAAAADSTQTVRGPNYDPVRHAKVQAALAAGDTATVNSIRAEHRAQMQAEHRSQGGRHGRHGQGGSSMGSCRGARGTATP